MKVTGWIDFWVTDVFADGPFQGNPAAVITEAAHLSSDTMRLVAREVGVTETTFVLPAEQEGSDLALRWFTSTCELPFSGHATVAALHVLAETGRYPVPSTLTLDTLSGPVKGWLQFREDRICPMVEVPLPHFEPSPLAARDLAEALLVSIESFAADLPLCKEGLNLLVPFHSVNTILNLYPDFRRLSRLGLEHDITGFICFSQADERDTHWNLRFFAPGIGISEDPVSGAAHGTVAVFLTEQGVLSPDRGREVTWIGEQGDNRERHGRVQVECTIDRSGRTSQVRIGGFAVTVIKGQLRIS